MSQFVDEAVRSVLDAVKKKKKKILLSTPTGQSAILAKTLTEYFPLLNILSTKVLYITDRRSLAEELQRNLINLYQDKDLVSIVTNSPNKSPILITTSQAFSSQATGLYKEMASIDFSFIFLVGCERMGIGNASNQLRDLLEHFGNATKIGIDNAITNSSNYFGPPVFSLSFSEAIQNGIFVPFRITQIRLPVLTNSDLQFIENDSSYPDIFGSPEFLKLIAKTLLEQIKDEKTIVFCRNQEQAERLSEIINTEKKNERFCRPVISNQNFVAAESIHTFKLDEEPTVLTSVDMLLTGVDLPITKHVAILRNIQSKTLLRQILSIGLRPYIEKEYLNVLDFIGLNDDIKSIISPDNPNKEEDNPTNNTEEDTWLATKKTVIFRDKSDVDGVLGVKDIAEELAEIISKMPGERGSMIGIFGKWGRGKTFLIDEIWKNLKKTKMAERVDFHAWKYQDTPASWAYLYETLSHKYSSSYHKSKIVKWFITSYRVLKLNFKRKGLLPILKFSFIFLLGSTIWFSLKYFSITKSQEFKNLVNYFGFPLAFVSTLYYLITYIKKEYSSEAKDLFFKYAKKHSFKEHLGIQAEIQKEIIILLKTWIRKKDIGEKKVIIFVDDIDRCSENKIIQLIDSLRVMLEDDEVAKRINVVTAIDERILKYAIRSKYRDLTQQDEALNTNILTKEYIDKLFITGVKLGDLSVQDRDEFFLEFIKNDRSDIIADNQTTDTSHKESFVENISVPTGEIIFPLEEESLKSNHEQSVGHEENVGPEKRYTPRAEYLLLEEVAVLRASLKDYDNVTPRQIRIFYFRYLISKNLLIKKYAKLSRRNIWLTHKYSKIYINLIIAYSQQEDPLLISQHKVKVLHTETPEINIFMFPDLMVPTKDYGELLKVLDIILAY